MRERGDDILQNKATSLLRSRTLAIYLFMAVSLPSLYGTLLPGPKAAAFFSKSFGQGFLPVGRFFGLVDTYHSPLFVFLLLLLCLNLLFCTWNRFLLRGPSSRGAGNGRRKAVRWLDLLLHASVLVVLAGGASKGIWAFTGTKNIPVGTSADVVFDWRLGREVPLGFAIDVKERVDEYYPVQARVGVTDSASGKKLGLLELGETYGGEIPSGGITLSLREFDAGERSFHFDAVIGGEEAEFELLAEVGGEAVAVGPYTFTLVAWRRELKTVRSLLSIVQDGEVVKEEWIAPNARVTHRNSSLYQTAWGEDQYRNPFIGIQVVRDPGAVPFWIGSIFFSVTLPLFLFLRHRKTA